MRCKNVENSVTAKIFKWRVRSKFFRIRNFHGHIRNQRPKRHIIRGWADWFSEKMVITTRSTMTRTSTCSDSRNAEFTQTIYEKRDAVNVPNEIKSGPRAHSRGENLKNCSPAAFLAWGLFSYNLAAKSCKNSQKTKKAGPKSADRGRKIFEICKMLVPIVLKMKFGN